MGMPENIQYLLGHMEHSKQPIGAQEVSELLGVHLSSGRELLSKCHSLGLLTKRPAGPKSFNGNRVIYERTDKTYVPPTRVGQCIQDFSGLLAAFSIPLVPPNGLRGRIHKLPWDSPGQDEFEFEGMTA